ncbi:hypothetical protein [Gelidibacter salicanalis]|uniref:Uncharacterized protein n=1 Tax=Gelidibacter salicanalis TaxID=291193 RepID=A0A934KJN0_9FLAO|nr:hypothetical protein [Gelidibacter salicanalis]MBJ7880701.1 hypothetical protein [Gelidibacter salicanalis]
MQSKIYIITLLLISSFIFSCSSDDDLNYQSDFEKSQNVWLDFKESSDNSYKYTVGSGSWAGSYKETTISVSNGVIIERYFKYTITDGLSEDIPKEELEWTENENEIGIHQNGAEPITLDEVYEKAQQDWLIKRNNTQTYFETENNGIISTCGYRDKNCVDDCFIGINIKSIETL